MIHYIFEDEQDDVLSILFRHSYNIDYCNKYFHYACGNGKLVKMAKDILENSSDDKVAIFIAMIPGNDSCNDLYKVLTRLTKDYMKDDRVIVFPVVCSEYYFIQALTKYTNLLDMNKDVNIALGKEDYTKSDIYLASFDHNTGKNKCKNFEKLCKYILIDYICDCAKHSRGHGDNINSKYGLYYDSNCKCMDCTYNCMGENIIEKSRQLLSMYDCIPGNSIHISSSVSWNEAKIIVNKLVDDYNSMSKKYSELGVGGDIAIYRKIKSLWR